MRGEAGEVEDKLRPRGGAGGESWFFPMTTYDEHGFRWRWECGGNRFEKALSGMPGVGGTPGPIHEEAGTPAVREENGWLTFGIGGHRDSPTFPGGLQPGISCSNNYLLHGSTTRFKCR
jgi:hypothetical protein